MNQLFNSGGILGLVIGVYSFFFMLIYWGYIVPTNGTIALTILSIMFALDIFTLYWPQLVLFDIPFIGFWYIIFLVQFIIYEKLDYELHIEELYEDARSSYAIANHSSSDISESQANML